jgi:hypothetical protein
MGQTRRGVNVAPRDTTGVHVKTDLNTGNLYNFSM